MNYSCEQITINNRNVRIPEILSGKIEALSDFESTTFSFIQDWLSGTTSFTLHTSGSTGAPKEITLSRNQLQQSAKRTIGAFELSENDTAFVCLDTKYIAGKMMLVRALEANMKILAVDPTANPLQNAHGKISFAAFVPLQLQEMVRHSDSVQKLNQMKSIIVGGGAVSTSLHKEIVKFTCPVYATYGMTETVSHIALQRLNGNAASDYFTALSGIALNKDERDCLAIQIPEFPEKIVTNDLVEMINPNQFRWLGRYDNIINSGGYKISPEKIEKALEELLRDQPFFVTGVPDERLGEKVVLLIEGKTIDLDLTKLPLHPYEIPKEIRFLKEFIRTETGKINRPQTTQLTMKYSQ